MHKNLSMLGDDQIERYCCGKEIMTPANATSTKTYMLKYWRQKSVLTDNNAQFFRDDIWKFRSFLLKGREYWIGNLNVVVTPDEEINNGDHRWMWKAKIEEFFILEFEGMQDCGNMLTPKDPD